MEARVCELTNEIACLDELNTIIVVNHGVTAATVADHLWLMGRDRDATGNIVPGARIQETYDLIERDLCWRTGITNAPGFLEFVREVKTASKPCRGTIAQHPGRSGHVVPGAAGLSHNCLQKVKTSVCT
jgi:hypothetical protein